MAKCRVKGENLLLSFTILGVVAGVVMGLSIKFSGIELTARQIWYLQLPGDLFLRVLKMVILPLISSSLICSMASMERDTAGRLGLLALGYYFSTTLLAVITGIALVLIIQPGKGGGLLPQDAAGEDALAPCTGNTAGDTIVDLMRNMFPDNLVEAAFKSTSTCFHYYRSARNTSRLSEEITYEEYIQAMQDVNEQFVVTARPVINSASGMNVLGVVVISLLLGGILGKYQKQTRPLIDVIKALEFTVMKIVVLAIWYSPIGIAFLIAAQILSMRDLQAGVARLGWYLLTVLGGLFLHGFVTLPVMLVVLGRRNPFRFVANMMQALLTALGTSSSSATMPLTFKCLEEKNGVRPQVSRFMIPLGATINMDGTALYEAVAAIYISQVAQRDLSFGEVILVSLTATLASIGAAGIPQAGLVTMIMVLVAVNLPPHLFALIIPVDWFLDRIRTMINVHGDSIGTAIVQRLCDINRVAPTPETEVVELGVNGVDGKLDVVEQ